MAAIWTDPQGIKRLILKIYGAGDTDDYACAVVEIDAAGVEIYARRAAAAAAAKRVETVRVRDWRREADGPVYRYSPEELGRKAAPAAHIARKWGLVEHGR